MKVTLTSLIRKIKGDKGSQSEIHKQTMKLTAGITDDNRMNNKLVYATIVTIVGCIMLITITFGCMIFLGTGKSQTAIMPEFLGALGVTTLGAVVIIISSNSRTK